MADYQPEFKPEWAVHGTLDWLGFLRFTVIVWLVCGTLLIGAVIGWHRSASNERDVTTWKRQSMDTPARREIERVQDFLQMAFGAEDPTTRIASFSCPENRREEMVAMLTGEAAPVVEKISYLTSNWTPDQRTSRHLFSLQTDKCPSGATTMVVNRDGALSIPWEPFYQFHEQTFEKFINERPQGKHRFYLIVQRAHNISPPAAVPREFLRFRLNGGIDRALAPDCYASPGNTSILVLKQHQKWNSPVEAVVVLEWARVANVASAEPFIHLAGLLSTHW